MFACDTNVGADVLVVSFAAPSGLCLFGCRGLLDLQTSGSVLPAWWQFKNPGSCRATALTSSADFFVGPPNCLDPWMQEAFSFVSAYETGLGGPNRARITATVSVVTECKSIASVGEFGAFKLIVGHAQTVGIGSCPGCTESACIVLNSLTLDDYNSSVVLTAPLVRNFVTWQADPLGCPASTPVLNRTWGAVKTLYR